jgi:hypothetical protein
LLAGAQARLDVRLGVLTASLEPLLNHVFGLLGRLSEVRV